MKTRNVQILRRLLDGRYHSIQDLASELSVSDRLVRYTLNDIDDFLTSNQINRLVYDRNLGVKLEIDKVEKSTIESLLSEINSYDYTVDSEERKLYILLSMFTNNDCINSKNIADRLSVSKSSIDKDILNLRKDLERYDISIISKGSKGSYIKGNEREIRMYIYRKVNRHIDFSRYIKSSSRPLSFIEKNINDLLFSDLLSKIRDAIDKSEKNNKMHLTYQSYKDICLHLAISIVRNRLGYKLEPFNELNIELLESKGYLLSKQIIDDLKTTIGCIFSKTDIAHLGIIINSARYTTMQGPVITDWANVQIIATSLIKKVSERINVDLTYDDELLNALTLHLGPTIFKLKNNIPVVNPNLTVVRREYLEMFKAVEQSLLDLDIEELYGIGEDDISYLALHFCASLERHKRFKQEYNVIIVCVHSIATASLMKEIICSKFKNIDVIKTVTRENLQNVDLNGVDFIISSIDLDNCIKPYIKVNAILKDSDVIAIQELMKKINNNREIKEFTLVDEVMKIVESNAMSDVDKIKNDLTKYFSSTGMLKTKSLSSLSDYLTNNKVQIISSVKSLEDAIDIVCEPLISNLDIDETYGDSIIKTINDVGNYMVIDKGVALVHGEMGKGVYNDSMSLLMIVDGVKFNHKKYDPIHMILCLATKNQKTLNKALSNFLEFLEDYQKEDKNKYFKKDYLLKQIKKASQND